MNVITYQPSWVSHELLAKEEKECHPLPASVPNHVAAGPVCVRLELLRAASQFKAAYSAIFRAFRIHAE